MSRSFVQSVILVIVSAMLGLSCGCATARAKVRSCAVVLLVEAQHRNPTVRQYETVKRSLGAQFEQRGMELVPDLISADLIATIEFRPDATNPGRTEVIVRHVGKNTFTRGTLDQAAHPSLRQVQREQEEAFRGFTRAEDL